MSEVPAWEPEAPAVRAPQQECGYEVLLAVPPMGPGRWVVPRKEDVMDPDEDPWGQPGQHLAHKDRCVRVHERRMGAVDEKDVARPEPVENLRGNGFGRAPHRLVTKILDGSPRGRIYGNDPGSQSEVCNRSSSKSRRVPGSDLNEECWIAAAELRNLNHRVEPTPEIVVPVRRVRRARVGRRRDPRTPPRQLQGGLYRFEALAFPTRQELRERVGDGCAPAPSGSWPEGILRNDHRRALGRPFQRPYQNGFPVPPFPASRSCPCGSNHQPTQPYGCSAGPRPGCR